MGALYSLLDVNDASANSEAAEQHCIFHVDWHLFQQDLPILAPRSNSGQRFRLPSSTKPVQPMSHDISKIFFCHATATNHISNGPCYDCCR